MTVTLPEPDTIATPVPVLPPVDDIPGKNLPELLEKLQDLGNADVIAEFFLAEGVRGEPNNAMKCPIAKWLAVETGGKYSVGGGSVCPIPSSDTELILANWGHHLPPAAQEFVRRFDNGEFADLAIGPAKGAMQPLCDCAWCHGWSNPDPLKETLAKLGHFSKAIAW